MASAAGGRRVSITNRRLVVDEGPDFYPTPSWGTRALLKYVTFEGAILEPCCGTGDMAEVLKTTGNEVVAADIHDRGYGWTRDFLDTTDRYPNIVTNPPFNMAEFILAHALGLASEKVCLLLRTAFLEGRGRYKNIFSVTPPSRLLVFTQRLSMYPAGAVVEGGGTTSYSWFVWDKADTSGETKITWIEPGLKPRIVAPGQTEMFGAGA